MVEILLLVVILFLFWIGDRLEHILSVLAKIHNKEARLPMTLPVESVKEKKNEET